MMLTHNANMLTLASKANKDGGHANKDGGDVNMSRDMLTKRWRANVTDSSRHTTLLP